MKGLCTAVSSSGILKGLWDGLTAFPSLIGSIFFNVSVYDVCSRSWWYNCMYLIGFLLSAVLGFLDPRFAAIVFAICLGAFVIWFILANILYLAAFLVVCVAMLWLWD